MKRKNDFLGLFTKLFLLNSYLFLFFNLSIAQSHFHSYYKNPVLSPTPGTFYAGHTDPGTVIYEDGLFKMWFIGIDDDWQVGYAESIDGLNWDIYPDPVLSPGPVGDIYESTIVSHTVIHTDSVYKMWYWGFMRDAEGTWSLRISYATSPDGLNWTKYTGNPVLDVGSEGSWDQHGVWCPSVVKVDSMYYMWYSGRSWDTGEFRTGYAISKDGINWTKYEGNPVSEQGPAGSWDDANQWNTFVMYNGKFFEMWYGGATSSEELPNSRIGYAISDDGIKWEKHPDNPVLEPGAPGTFEAAWVESPKIIKEGNIVHMWYQGNSSKNLQRNIRTTSYARDFSRIPHADSIYVNPSYVNPTVDILSIHAKIHNPENSSLRLYAVIEDENRSIVDSTQLIYQHDNTWSGKWQVIDGERTYNVGIKTVDMDSGWKNYSPIWNIYERFTSVGPIRVQGFAYASTDSIINPGDNCYFRLRLENQGTSMAARNISAVISSPDSSIKLVNVHSAFKDIAPGESVFSNWAYYIQIPSDFSMDRPIELNVSIASDGDYFWYDTLNISVLPTFVEHERKMNPKEFSLHQNYPNPFNPTTTIKYSLPENSKVVLKIFNLLGEEIVTLVDEFQTAGEKSVVWDGLDRSGRLVNSGVYLYTLQDGNAESNRKMIFIK